MNNVSKLYIGVGNGEVDLLLIVLLVGKEKILIVFI